MTGNWTPGPGPTDGDDSYTGSNSWNVADGEGGNDTLLGEGASDLLYGGDGDDSLLGGTGDDVLIGGRGDDVLSGGTGNDLLVGGSGDDTFFYNQGDGDDTIFGGVGKDQVLVYAPGGYTTSTDGIFTRVDFKEGGDHLYVSGAKIVESSTPLPCFAEGTRIMTARGEVAVEALRIGDLAVACNKGRSVFMPITWIGHSRVDLAAHPRRAAVAPIRIGAEALGDGAPARDLRVSPEHALFIDGNLVPAHLLVNDETITQERHTPHVTYWHVELEEHAVLIANGVPAESYLDDGNRQSFDNGDVVALIKDFSHRDGSYAERACAPLLTEGPALDRIRAAIAARVSTAHALRQRA
ncbi:hypothetical protein GXW78_04755 [Roseomonas terrae]|uniref:Hedgehog/Intein (Hint) domain-containing protein n=1 Tax=Neoroseomonas terrae TaxID=424799 RepID=A0ABS5ED65_9PROT|nr:Hint domain-containing protein [Neoroseomonas terrae]MBR0648961.1 hypothetical protein [Neoroseomonas terrae]